MPRSRSTRTDPRHTPTRRACSTSPPRTPRTTATATTSSHARKAGFDTAIAVGPDYADTYYFRGILYAFSLRDFARSQVDLQNYLVRAPNGPWSAGARKLLAQVTEQLTPSTTVVPPATTKK